MHELKKIDEEIFLDRDGQAFETLVNYLRNDRKVFPEFSDKNSENQFYKEMHYWGIDAEHKDWQEKYLRSLDKMAYKGQGKTSAPKMTSSYPTNKPEVPSKHDKPP